MNISKAETDVVPEADQAIEATYIANPNPVTDQSPTPRRRSSNRCQRSLTPSYANNSDHLQIENIIIDLEIQLQQQEAEIRVKDTEIQRQTEALARLRAFVPINGNPTSSENARRELAGNDLRNQFEARRLEREMTGDLKH